MHSRVQKIQKDHTGSAKGFLPRFARDEDGGLIIFGVYVFLIILMVGGIGIDLMRFERDRAELQNTLDRAVLAAADLDQTLAPCEVVADYFNKADLSEYLTSCVVDQGLGFRSVAGAAQLEMATQFMHMTGVDTLSTSPSASDGDSSIASTAEERIDGIEISLVLDVSGSMNSNSRLTNLKVAAREFIDDMIANTEDGKLSISIIPYATQVSMSSNFINEFNISQEHTYSNCVNFQANDFLTTGVSRVDPLERTMHFNVWHYFEGRMESPPDMVPMPVCEDSTSREMLVMQRDADTLKDFITDLSAAGNTSIDVGMKWGTALLDPAMRPVINNLIAAGDIDPIFAPLPLAFDSDETLKVIVLMTDGQNTSQYFVEPQFRSGNSDVWWNAGEERYSVYDPDRDEFYWPDDEDWEDHAFGNDPSEDGNAVALSYPALWAFTSIAENMRENYRPWMGNAAWNAWYFGVFDSVGAGAKNTRTQNICDTVKDEGAIVFTIGFEAPSSGEEVLLDCASSPSHFYDVDGLEISDAFASIASSIRKLRLTQ